MEAAPDVFWLLFDCFLIFLLNLGIDRFRIERNDGFCDSKFICPKEVKTKTDRVDARTIATMLMSDVDLKANRFWG